MKPGFWNSQSAIHRRLNWGRTNQCSALSTPLPTSSPPTGTKFFIVWKASPTNGIIRIANRRLSLIQIWIRASTHLSSNHSGTGSKKPNCWLSSFRPGMRHGGLIWFIPSSLSACCGILSRTIIQESNSASHWSTKRSISKTWKHWTSRNSASLRISRTSSVLRWH